MYMRGGNWKKNDRTGNAWRKGYFSVIGEIYVLRINDNFFFFFWFGNVEDKTIEPTYCDYLVLL